MPANRLTFVLACLLTGSILTGCMDDNKEPVNVGPGGGGGRRVVTKPVPLDPMDDATQLTTAFEEIARFHRNSILSIARSGPANDGCIKYSIDTKPKDKVFMNASYNCESQVSRKSLGTLVRKDSGVEAFAGEVSRTGEVVSLGVKSVGFKTTLRKLNEKALIASGTIERSLFLKAKPQAADSADAVSKLWTASSNASIRSSVVGRDQNGEALNVRMSGELESERLANAGYNLTLRKGTKITFTYTADRLADKKAPTRILTFVANGDVTFGETCPRPFGSFAWELSVNGDVTERGNIALDATGLRLDKTGSPLIPWPARCLDAVEFN